MPARRLIDVDIRIAKIREEIKNGRASEIAQVELAEFLQQREELIKTLAAQPRRDIDSN